MLKTIIAAASFIAAATLSTGALAGKHGHFGGHWGGHHSAFPWELAAPTTKVVKIYVQSPAAKSCSYFAGKYERTGASHWLRKYETCVIATR